MLVQDKKVYFFTKRIFDIIFSFVGLILASPLLIVSICCIIIETPSGPFYTQARVGKDGKPFNIYKLRSMFCDAEKDGAQWADRNDPRITKVGYFIRKTRIDELPQFINVLKGEMSIIGPRPEREVFIREFEVDIPNFRERLSVKPGLTGWAQVNGGYDIEPKDKLKLDLFYIENLGFKLDIIILLKTISVIITGDGAR